MIPYHNMASAILVFIGSGNSDFGAKPWLECSFIMKTHVRGFFDTDLHEVSWHFATHEAVRPSGF